RSIVTKCGSIIHDIGDRDQPISVIVTKCGRAPRAHGPEWISDLFDLVNIVMRRGVRRKLVGNSGNLIECVGYTCDPEVRIVVQRNSIPKRINQLGEKNIPREAGTSVGLTKDLHTAVWRDHFV